MHFIGAAFACAAPFVPSWNSGYQDGSDVGGLMAAVLTGSYLLSSAFLFTHSLTHSLSPVLLPLTHPTHFTRSLTLARLTDSDSRAMRGFGKFLTVLVALSVPSACAPTMYSFGTSAMNITSLDAIKVIPAFVRRIPRNVYAIVSFGM